MEEDLKELILAEVAILEKLFSHETLTDPNLGHPAAKRWQTCQDLLTQDGFVHWPAQADHISTLQRLQADSLTFIGISDGDLQSYRLGKVEGYGDNLVQRKLWSRINDPAQFQDLLLELRVASWHKLEGHTVTPTEADGLADLRIDIPDLDLPLLLECKNLSTTSPNRVGALVRKANTQIRNVGIEAYGILLIEATQVVSTPPDPNGAIPAEIQAIAGLAKRAVSGPKNRAVSRVIVAWDEQIPIGQPPARSGVALRRCHLSIDHEPVAGVRGLAPNVKTYAGGTLLLALDWHRQKYPIVVKELEPPLVDIARLYGIGKAEILHAISNATNQEQAPIDSDHAILVIIGPRSVSSSTPIVVKGTFSKSTLIVDMASPLPPDVIRLSQRRTPLEILRTLAERHGYSITIAATTSYFVKVAEVPVVPNTQILYVDADHSQGVLFSAWMKAYPVEGNKVLRIAGALALNPTSLSAAMG